MPGPLSDDYALARLALLFPGASFSFSQGAAPALSWVDGPTVLQVLTALSADLDLLDGVLASWDPLSPPRTVERSLSLPALSLGCALLLPVSLLGGEDGDLGLGVLSSDLLSVVEAWASGTDLSSPSEVPGASPLVRERAEVLHRLALDAGASSPLLLVLWAEDHWADVVALVP